MRYSYNILLIFFSFLIYFQFGQSFECSCIYRYLRPIARVEQSAFSPWLTHRFAKITWATMVDIRLLRVSPMVLRSFSLQWHFCRIFIQLLYAYFTSVDSRYISGFDRRRLSWNDSCYVKIFIAWICAFIFREKWTQMYITNRVKNGCFSA